MARHLLLHDWLAGGRVGRVLDLGDVEATTPIRCVRLANARNACLAAAMADNNLVDHWVMFDLDDVLAQPIDVADFNAAADFLDAKPQRAGVFANSAPRYYDIWALRHEAWCPDDCWAEVEQRGAQPRKLAQINFVYKRQIRIPRRAQPIRVRSAFGGLGIYKMGFASLARYAGLDSHGNEVVDHLAFNDAIGRAGGELQIFPRLMVTASHQIDMTNFGRRHRLRIRAMRAMQEVTRPWRTYVRKTGR